MNFFKSIVVHTLMTLISALILLFVGAIGIVIWDSYKNGNIVEPARKFKEVETIRDSSLLSKDLQIVDLEQQADFENFTVKGKIKNISQRTYFSFRVDLEYFVEDIKMGECFHYTGESRDLKAGESIGFMIECSGFKPKKLPSQFSFRTTVESASRYTK